MNELIFMMWLADVSSSIGTVGTLILIALAFISVVVAFLWIDSEGAVDLRMLNTGFFRKSMIATLVFLAISAIMPSKQTIYAAVALKAGSEIVESRIGQKAVGAIEAILDEVIAKKDKK